MKTLLKLLLPFVLLLSGCQTNNNNPDSVIARMAGTAKSAAYLGASYYLLKNPGQQEQFRTVANGINLLIEQGTLDPVTLHAAVSQLPIKQLASPEAVIAVQAAFLLWDSYGQKVDVNDIKYALPVATGIRDGLNLALQANP